MLIRLCVALLTVFFLGACSEDTVPAVPPTPTQVCIPGMSIGCVGACGTGFQICNATGSGYSGCECASGGSPDTGVNGGADAGVNPTMDAGSMTEQDAGTTPGEDAGTMPEDDAGTMPEDDAGTAPPTDAGAGQDAGTPVMMDATTGGMDAAGNTDAGVVVTGPCTDPWCNGSTSSGTDGGVCITDHSRFWPTLDHVGGTARLQRSASVPGEPTVVDQYSTIEWTGCPLGTSGTDCSNGSLTSVNGTSLVSNCSNLLWGGHSDWVAPTPEMILSIQDATRARQSMDEQAFPRAAEPLMSVLDAVFGVLIYTDIFGFGSPSTSRTGFGYCVRFPQGVDLRTPVSRCYDSTLNRSAEPTVNDLATQLTWQVCLDGTSGTDCSTGSPVSKTWEQALNYCENLNWAGQTDWSLPTLEQSRSLVNTANRSIPISENVLSGVQFGFWTKTFEPGSGFVRPYSTEFNSTAIRSMSQTSRTRCVRENGVFDRAVIYPTQSCREIEKTFLHDDYQSTVPRFTRDLSTPGEPVVNDAFVDVEWTGCPDGVTGDTCASGMLRNISSASIESTCENLNWAGHSDWEAPSAAMLSSFNNFTAGTWQAEVSTAFPNLGNAVFGSKTRLSPESTSARVVRADGYAYNDNSANVLCVRAPAGGSLPGKVQHCLQTTTWSTNEPLVSDMTNGLDWMGCIAGYNGRGCTQGSSQRAVYQMAVSYCDGLNWAGQSDWRLPTLSELSSGTDSSGGAYFGLNPFAFSDHGGSLRSADSIWTTTRSPTNQSWVIKSSGITPLNSASSYYMRCVRDR